MWQIPSMNSEKQRQSLVDRNTKHGLTKAEAATYRSWKDARARCRNPNNSDYHRYGARGISFCNEWDDFAKFFEDMGRRPFGLSLERVNRDGNYEPGNCEWADKYTQANNRCNNHPITAWGRTQNLQAWCDEVGMDPSRVRYRLKVGYTPEKALTLGDLRRVG